MPRKLVIIALMILGLGLAVPSSAYAVDTDNFDISNYEIEYNLSRDDEKVSTLETTERITANFPSFDQNHGLERYMPTKYFGNDVKMKIRSVTDDSGRSVEYSTAKQGDVLRIRIGDADKYVHGTKTYVIKYQQRGVTHYYQEENRDDFYWDTNGTDWRVPISNLKVKLTVEPSAYKYYKDSSACYFGRSGSSSSCQLNWIGNTAYASATNLSPGQNITVALAFKPHTFVVPPMTLSEKIFKVWWVTQIVLIPIALIAAIWLIRRYTRVKNRKGESVTIVPEYLPPSDSSVTTSGKLMASYPSRVFSAQLIDFAVRHYMKIYETKPKRGVFKPAEYEIEIIKDISTLRDEEREVVDDIFNGKTAVGTRLSMKDLRNDTKLYSRLQDNEAKLKKLLVDNYQLRAKVPKESAVFKKLAIWTTILTVLTLSPALMVVSILAFSFASVLTPVTDKGYQLMRYLDGLKMYISIAEKDRLEMLQSPEGAEKTGVDGASDSKKLVRLYERVLPYAILFGQEKDWNKSLGKFYQESNSQPDWYSSNSGTAFNAATFGSAISSFNSSASSTSSSSSSGSGGGGYSGGGGGGGGGGGW